MGWGMKGGRQTVFERFNVKAKGNGIQRTCWAKKSLSITNIENRVKIHNVCIVEKSLEIQRSHTFQNFRGRITDFEKMK